MKQKPTGLRLYMKPEPEKPLGDLKYVWISRDEKIPDGFKRAKKLKRGIDYDGIRETHRT